ncbi:MAG: hypothetical protein IJQ86_02315 [Spirochaetia bacterium]|nr:hypothetical protein [Spirochaetia bacterium]
MKEVKNLFGTDRSLLFGLFKGSALSDNDQYDDTFDDYKKFHNSIDKQVIIKHIEELPFFVLAPMLNHDIFNGAIIKDAGFYRDGDFLFPTDFLYYLKKYDIGIPYEYEEYLKSLGIVLRPSEISRSSK